MARKRLINLKLTEEQFALVCTLMELYKYEVDVFFAKELSCKTYNAILEKVKSEREKQ